jgi:phosphoribosyl 1,2-cyclic phosphate phosphodiesterase
MKITILGSGGFRIVPRPGCDCRVCAEARRLGMRRLGPAIFVHDRNILFDTPEDIALELENAGVMRVDHIFYTHWHPDHTLGARVVEQLNTKWSEDMKWKMAPKNCTTIHLPGQVHAETYERLGPFFDFWQHIGVAKIEQFDTPVAIGNVTVEALVIKTVHRTTTHSAIYLITSGSKKVLYAPCDITPFPKSEKFKGCDAMIMQAGWWGAEMEERARKGPHYEISLAEELAVADLYKPKQLILTHIGDDLGMTLGDLKDAEKKYSGYALKFALDEMALEI